MGQTNKFFDEAEIICPFYKGADDSGFNLRCEGAIGDGVLSHWFRTQQARKRYMITFCKSFSYGKCPVSRMLLEKYKAG